MEEEQSKEENVYKEDIAFKDLIETKVILELDINEEMIQEEIKLYFKKKTLIKNMFEKIIDNFNTLFKEKDKNIYLRPEGINYKLCEIQDNQEENTNINKNIILNGSKKLIDTNSKNFKLICDTHDIILNYREKRSCACAIF